MVVCLKQGAYLHMTQLMPLPLTVSCFSKIQIGFTFLVPVYLGSPGKGAVKRVWVCVVILLFRQLVRQVSSNSRLEQDETSHEMEDTMKPGNLSCHLSV